MHDNQFSLILIHSLIFGEISSMLYTLNSVILNCPPLVKRNYSQIIWKYFETPYLAFDNTS